MLPNLPGLASQWLSAVNTVPIVLGQWVEILPPDPTRWALMIAPGVGGMVQVWFVPEPTQQEGINVQYVTPLIMFYKDWGPLIQGSIFAVDLNGKGSISTATASIALRPEPAGTNNPGGL